MTRLSGTDYLKRGVDAARSGDKVLARLNLLRASELEPGNPDCWLWIARSAECPETALLALQRVLAAWPEHEAARAGVVWMEALSRLDQGARDTEPPFVFELPPVGYQLSKSGTFADLRRTIPILFEQPVDPLLAMSATAPASFGDRNAVNQDGEDQNGAGHYGEDQYGEVYRSTSHETRNPGHDAIRFLIAAAAELQMMQLGGQVLDDPDSAAAAAFENPLSADDGEEYTFAEADPDQEFEACGAADAPAPFDEPTQEISLVDFDGPAVNEEESPSEALKIATDVEPTIEFQAPELSSAEGTSPAIEAPVQIDLPPPVTFEVEPRFQEAPPKLHDPREIIDPIESRDATDDKHLAAIFDSLDTLIDTANVGHSLVSEVSSARFEDSLPVAADSFPWTDTMQSYSCCSEASATVESNELDPESLEEVQNTEAPNPTGEFLSIDEESLSVDKESLSIDEVSLSIDGESLSVDAASCESSRAGDVETSPSQAIVHAGNAKVLIVDDNDSLRLEASRVLVRHGFQVLDAADGIQAMPLLAQVPDLILLDTDMPRVDGYQLCKMIKQVESLKHIPVVLMSDKDGLFDKLRGRLAGSVDCINKPLEAEGATYLIEQYLQPAGAGNG